MFSNYKLLYVKLGNLKYHKMSPSCSAFEKFIVKNYIFIL